MSWRLSQLYSSLKELDFRQAAAWVSWTFTAKYFERWYGIQSSGKVSTQELGIDSSFCHGYEPTDYRTLREIMRRLAIRRNVDVFLDFGAGMGRTVVVAATYPFRAVTGVEISPELSAIARDNVRRAARRLKCTNVQIVTQDAASYAIPGDVTTILFFNPFHGDVMASVLANIRSSLRERPRVVTLVFVNPRRFEEEAKAYGWLRKTDEFSFAPQHWKTVFYSVCSAAGEPWRAPQGPSQGNMLEEPHWP